MYSFGPRSAARLLTCHKDLQRLMNEAIKGPVDFTVLCGYRSQIEQDAAVTAGASKLHWPKSKHNKYPSLAVDVVPYPIDWDDITRFQALANHINATAKKLGIFVRHGADWNMNGIRQEEKEWDWPHWELMI